MPDPVSVYNDIVNFFASPSVPFHPVAGRLVPYEANQLQGAASSNKSLFETILGRRPEKRAQDALYPYLSSRHPTTRREHAFRDEVLQKRRYFDFFIGAEGGQDRPVIIELKHYSVHQPGRLRGLLGGPNSKFSIYTDRVKARPSAHFIQVGILTAVERFPRALRSAPDANPFIRSYVHSPAPAGYIEEATADLLAWPYRQLYSQPGGNESHIPLLNTTGPASGYMTRQGKVEGRVLCFVGLTL